MGLKRGASLWDGDIVRYSKGLESALTKRITEMDEYSFETESGVEDEIVELSEKAIVQAGVNLKLSLALAAEGKKSFEGSWRDTH